MKFYGLLCIVCSIICAVFIGRSEGAITGWSTPAIGTKDGNGTVSTPVAEDLASGASTNITLGVTGTTGTLAFSIVSQPTNGKLTISADGLLTLAATFSFDFETEPTYVIVVKCDESGPANDSATATVTLSITDVNEAPEFADSQYGFTIPDGSTAGTTLTTVTATDQDTGDTIFYSIYEGNNTSTDFAISSSGVITVAPGKTLTRNTTGGYGLFVVAADNGTLNSYTTVYVVVKTCGASAAMVGIMTLTLVAISMFV